MGIYRVEEIESINRKGKIFCAECMPDDFTEDEIITDKMTEDGETFYFCDECKKRFSVTRGPGRQGAGASASALFVLGWKKVGIPSELEKGWKVGNPVGKISTF